MAQRGKGDRDRRIAWWLVTLAVVGFVASSVLLLGDAPATTIAIAIASTIVIYIVAIVWSSLTITRNSRVGGDFVMFAGGFNVIFVWAPIVGMGMNLLAASRLLRGMVKGGTITTTSGSSSSSSTMDDTQVGAIAKPLGACNLIAALLQPAVLGLVLLGVFADPFGADRPPLPSEPTVAERCDMGEGVACREHATSVMDKAAAGLRGARAPLDRACQQGDELACSQRRALDATLERLGDLRDDVARPPAEAPAP